jgi:hypothetical protein
MATLVCIEQGSKKAFASALDWPGWSRSGKTEELALATLADCAGRYAAVPAGAELEFDRSAGDEFEIVERLAGNVSTDFGVPGLPADYELAALDAKEALRLAALVAAGWDLLEKVVTTAPATLRKGPRGGGRDRDKVVEHVQMAELAYAAKIGVRAGDDPGSVRPRVLEVIGTPAPARLRGEKGWPVRYAARRIAWHAVDHAWEIEDKSE